MIDFEKLEKLKKFFDEEIKHLSKNSWHCSNVSLSHFCKDGNELVMWHDVAYDQIKFKFTDNSKPLYYKEFVDGNVVEKKFEDKIKCIAVKYPYYIKSTPAKLVATVWNLFNVFEYEYQKENIDKLPDYKEVERIIYKALEIFKISI